MSDYEVVFCIVNAGYSELVMDAAKEVGARGGTVIHARGTANKEAEKFFSITIQPDKEIVMILVPSKIKDEVLRAIYLTRRAFANRNRGKYLTRNGSTRSPSFRAQRRIPK